MSEFKATTNNDHTRAQNIRKQYIPSKENKMEQLKRLDSKVKRPGRIVSSIIGAIGALTLGTGMCFVMVWNQMTPGIVIGIPGMIVALAAYPIYKAITGSRKKKYASEIFKLSDEIENH